jgi:hypothetical protein
MTKEFIFWRQRVVAFCGVYILTGLCTEYYGSCQEVAGWEEDVKKDSCRLSRYKQVLLH